MSPMTFYRTLLVILTLLKCIQCLKVDGVNSTVKVKRDSSTTKCSTSQHLALDVRFGHDSETKDPIVKEVTTMINWSFHKLHDWIDRDYPGSRLGAFSTTEDNKTSCYAPSSVVSYRAAGELGIPMFSPATKHSPSSVNDRTRTTENMSTLSPLKDKETHDFPSCNSKVMRLVVLILNDTAAIPHSTCNALGDTTSSFRIVCEPHSDLSMVTTQRLLELTDSYLLILTHHDYFCNITRVLKSAHLTNNIRIQLKDLAYGVAKQQEHPEDFLARHIAIKIRDFVQENLENDIPFKGNVITHVETNNTTPQAALEGKESINTSMRDKVYSVFMDNDNQRNVDAVLQRLCTTFFFNCSSSVFAVNVWLLFLQIFVAVLVLFLVILLVCGCIFRKRRSRCSHPDEPV